jgi:hypothetical protein
VRAFWVVLVVMVVGLGAGCGDEPGPPKVLAEDAGAYGGIVIGEPVPADAAASFGGRCKEPDNIAPCEVSADDITGPRVLPGEWDWDNRDQVTMFTYRGQVKALLIADSAAETNKGVGIGDDLSSVEARYPQVECNVQRFEDSTGNPYCDIQLPGRLKLLFGGDPIDSIVIGRPGFG